MQPLLRYVRFGLLLSTLVAATAASQAVFVGEARAQSSEKKKVAVGVFEGPKSDEARSAFIEALKKDGDYEVTDAEDVKHTAKNKAIADAAKSLAVNVVITGKVQKHNLKLKVRSGLDGKIIDQPEIKGGTAGKLKANIGKTGVSSVAAAIAEVKVETKKAKKEEEPKPAETEEALEEDAPAEDTAVPADEGSGGGLSPLNVTAGLRPYHRTFTFHQTLADLRPNDNYGQLMRYELPLGPALFIDLNFYPASLFTEGAAEWIGITGGFEKGFATESVAFEGGPDETSLKTDLQQFYAGLRFRLPLGAHELNVSGVYGQQTFALKGDENRELVPDVKYSYVKPGVGGLFRFGDFLAGAHVGKRFVLDTGALQSVWFPNVSANSLEAGLTVGYRLISVLDLVAGFDWLRYAFDFNPVPIRPGLESYVAGGAVDQYMSGYIAFRFHLPGGESGGDGSASASFGGE